MNSPKANLKDAVNDKNCCRPLGKKNTIRIVFIVFFACAGFVGGFFIPAAESPPGTPPPPDAYIVIVNIVLVIESAVLGAGFAFIVTYASSVKKAPKKLKKKILLTYITISWLLVQWWPHAQLHKYFGFNIDAVLGLEMSFHWVNSAALTVLAVYQFQIILLCIALNKTKENLSRLERGEKTRDEEKAEKRADQNCCQRFWRNIKVHVAIITVGAAAIMYFGVSKAFERPPPGQLPDLYIALFILVDVISALFFGVGCSWAILAAVAIYRRVSPQHQRPAWASYVAIAYIFLSDWFHVKAHSYVLPGDWWGLLVIEIVFHCGITAAGLILVYYQRKIITGYRKKNRRDGSTAATNSGSQSTTTSDYKLSGKEKEGSSTHRSADKESASGQHEVPYIVTQATPRASTARTDTAIEKSESESSTSSEDYSDMSSSQSMKPAQLPPVSYSNRGVSEASNSVVSEASNVSDRSEESVVSSSDHDSEDDSS